MRSVHPWIPSGKRVRTILALAGPIMGGMASQNLLNLVDTAMVGRLGAPALAAVGTASFANFMGLAVLMGLSTSVQAIAARRLGEGLTGELARSLNAALVVAVIFGAPWGALLHTLVPVLFPLLTPDQEVVSLGVPYLEARVLSAVAVGMNFSFRGYWNGIGRSTLYFRTLVVMHATNIALNWVLIFGNLGAPALGTEGAGIASMVSTYAGTGLYIVLGLRHARSHGFLRVRPGQKMFRAVLGLSIPSSIQQTLFAAGMVATFAIYSRVGTAETAVANVVLNVVLVALLPGLGFGMASASLVGQALGRGDVDDAARWGWDVSKLTGACVALLSLPFVVLPEVFLGVFLQDADTLAMARAPLQISGLALALDTAGLVWLNSLLGAGASRTVMFVSVGLQWVLFLPLAYLLGPVLGFGLLPLWWAQVGYRLLQALVFGLLWQGRSWASIRL